MKKIHQICLSMVLTFIFATLTQAAMYKWVDKDGNTHYTQQPPSDTTYERINVHTQSPSGSSSSSQSNGPTYSTPSSSSNGGDASAVIKQQEAKGEEMRQKNCAAAKQQLETYTAFRRIRKKDGSVVYLDDNERAKRIEDAKSAIKEFCQ